MVLNWPLRICRYIVGTRSIARDFSPRFKLSVVHCYNDARSISVQQEPKRKQSESKMDRPSKRIKRLSGYEEREGEQEGEAKKSSLFPHDSGPSASETTSRIPNQDGRRGILASLNRSISPPRRLYSSSGLNEKTRESRLSACDEDTRGNTNSLLVPSPIRLTHIRDLPANSDNNVDTIKLKDILSDPMIRECWQFNYMFDVDFLMRQFDEDVRNLVKVKVVHGSWKRESPNRLMIEEGCSRYPNVQPVIAYMPEPFGTHHSKMMILFRHDDLAQVVIHTANMIPGDWANMCQAVWQSPLLPLQKAKEGRSSIQGLGGIGSGSRFKRDLLSYLAAYGTQKTGPLVRQLSQFDFSAVRAALVASVPSKQKVDQNFSVPNSQRRTLWGWPALKDTLAHIPTEASRGRTGTPHIVVQISSVATLGQTDKWLKQVLFDSLAREPETNININTDPTPKTGTKPSHHSHITPKYSIIFPTPDEIRRSLNGYSSGGSIHMKLQTPPQQKQLQYIRPYLCQWAGDSNKDTNDDADSPNKSKYKIVGKPQKQNAGRRRAAPHIKTYIRFSDAERMDSIDWAMVTSANLSSQAWGAAVNANGEVRISSWEVGVVVWPGLYGEEDEWYHHSQRSSTEDGYGEGHHQNRNTTNTTTTTTTSDSHYRKQKENTSFARMIPCFKRDLPAAVPPCEQEQGVDSEEKYKGKGLGEGNRRVVPQSQSVLVGLRMPYDLPLTPYESDDVPWCATAVHQEPDWLGRTWED